jgi:hypothetical protein
LRLRESGSGGSFLSYDFILGTMLHELVHNVHGPHNATFYALLDKINDVSFCMRNFWTSQDAVLMTFSV